MKIVIEIDDEEIRRLFAPLISPSLAPAKPGASRSSWLGTSPGDSASAGARSMS